MATEIELKAHVRDSETLRRLLNEKAKYLGAFEKDDTYWQLPNGSRLRVRREKRQLPDGTEEHAVFATRKAKKVRDGIEVNDEREFKVIPGKPFEEFLRETGFKPGFSKQKRGWAFSYREITAELVGITGLGWFIELEILVPDGAARREEAAAKERERLLDFLAELGINQDAIESRFYSEMLGG